MIQNQGKKIKTASVVAFFAGFLAAVYALAQNRAAMEDYIGLLIFYVVLMLASCFGVTLGLVFSLLGVFAFGAHHFFQTIVAQLPVDVNAHEFIWIAAFPVAAIAGGYLGDSSSFIEKLFSKYHRQIESLLLTGQLGMMGNEDTFQNSIREECSRSRRSLAQFSVILLEVANQEGLQRLLGADAPILAAEKLSQALCRNTRDIDRKAKRDETLFGLILPDCPADACQIVIDRVVKALKHVDMEYRGRSVKVDIGLILGIATYPKDGNDPQRLLLSAQLDFDKNKNSSNAQFAKMNPPEVEKKSENQSVDAASA